MIVFELFCELEIESPMGVYKITTLAYNVDSYIEKLTSEGCRVVSKRYFEKTMDLF